MADKNAAGLEKNGVNPVADEERYGTPAGLFPVWFSWNISIFGMALGFYVYQLGLSVMQAIAAGVLGYILSCSLVGALAVGSVRTGLPTLTQSRFAFGYYGNKIPTLFGYIANMGWKITMISLATTTGADLFANIWPDVFAEENGYPADWCIFAWFVVIVVLIMAVAVYGYQLILKVEKIIAWITGIMTGIYILFLFPHIDFGQINNSNSGDFGVFLGGVVMAMTMVGLGFLNYGGDFARYLPRKTKAGGIIFWTTTGIALPVSVLLILGVLLSAGNPELIHKATIEPIAALTSILPFWFYVPFSIIIIISLVSAGITGIYSSGLALLAMGVPISRALTTLLNGVIIALGSFYLMFISDSFLATFQAFLATISVIIGSWGAIELVDFKRQKALKWDVSMALPEGQGGKNYRWTALASLAAATIIGLGTITSADQYIAYIVSFLLTPDGKESVFAKANIGVVIAMITAGAVYYVLTFVCRFETKKNKDKQ